MSRKQRVYLPWLALIAALALAARIQAAPISVTNASFEDYEAITPGTTGGWGSLPSGHSSGPTAATLLVNDEFFTNPSNFGSGWQSNGPQPSNGKYGLQHPSDAHHARDGSHQLIGPFHADFIGFVNIPPTETINTVVTPTAIASVQSGILGNLQEGTYTLTIAFGSRRGTGGANFWNDYQATISLVTDPVLGAPDNGGPALGSRDGAVLGTPSSMTVIPSLVPSGSAASVSLADLTYTVNLGSGDPSIGKPYAIRIGLQNLLTDNGVADATGFTQGNFDNVRLEYIPEPGTLVLGAMAVLAAGAVGRRRQA